MDFREGTFEVKVISRDKQELKGQLLKLIALEKEKSTKKREGGVKNTLWQLSGERKRRKEGENKKEKL